MNMHYHFFHGISSTNAHVQLNFLRGFTEYIELVTIIAVPPFFRFRATPPLIFGHSTMNPPLRQQTSRGLKHSYSKKS